MTMTATGPVAYVSPVGDTHVNVGLNHKYSTRQQDGTWVQQAQTLVQFSLPQNHPATDVLLAVKPGAIVSVEAGAFFIKTFYSKKQEKDVNALELRQVRQVSLVANRTFAEKVGLGELADAEGADTPRDLVDTELPM